MKSGKYVLWTMIGCQLVVWGWFSVKGGELPDRHFYIFTAGMMLGQIGAGIETFKTKAWGTFVIQVYFLFFTLLAGLNRYRG